MATMFDYLMWRGDLTFTQSQFGMVDAAILSSITFIDYGTIGSGNDIKLSEAIKDYCADGNYGSVEFGLIVPAVNTNRLFCKTGRTKRFGGIVVSDFVEYTNEDECVQFAAMTYHLTNEHMAIAFRGTDDSIIGWREDCCLAYLDEIPAQRMALEYLERVAAKYPEKKIYVLGHSKGGNLTLFSCLRCSDSIASRIARAYCFDGPGLAEEEFKGARYAALRNRLEIILPQAATVGIMFSRGDRYTVVHSDGRGLMQHDMFTWELIGPRFKVLPELSSVGKIHETRFRARMSEMTLEEKKDAVETIFNSIAESGVKTLSELKSESVTKIMSIFKTYGANDKQKRELVKTLLFKK